MAQIAEQLLYQKPATNTLLHELTLKIGQIFVCSAMQKYHRKNYLFGRVSRNREGFVHEENLEPFL